jgi:hypothetical protein
VGDDKVRSVEGTGVLWRITRAGAEADTDDDKEAKR